MNGRREGKTMGRVFKISILSLLLGKSSRVRVLSTPLGISEFQRWGLNLDPRRAT
jgi:hypothetical protein